MHKYCNDLLICAVEVASRRKYLQTSALRQALSIEHRWIDGLLERFNITPEIKFNILTVKKVVSSHLNFLAALHPGYTM